MSQIIPANAVSRKYTKLFDLDASNFTSGSTTLVDSAQGIVATFGGAISKDADGMYASSDLSAVVLSAGSGGVAVPTLSGFVACIGIVKPAGSSNLTTTLGNVTTGPSIISVGHIYLGGSNNTSGRVMTNAMTTAGATIASMGIFDYDKLISPVGMCAAANVTLSKVDNYFTSITGTEFSNGVIAPSMVINALAGTAGDRFKKFAVIRFDTMPSPQEMLRAVQQMQLTGIMYDLWSEAV